jgi:DNA repair photolyase
LVVAKVWERLVVSKRPVNKMDMHRFNVRKLKEEVKEQYLVTIKTRFSALENLKDNGQSTLVFCKPVTQILHIDGNCE